MNIDPIILVSGFGRCGSSLVMQMLHTAGVPCVGEWHAFEDARTGHDTFDPAWVGAQHGRAVKLLDPTDLIPHLPAAPYRVIWLDRDRRQQAQSHAKFLQQVMGQRLSRADRRAYERSLRADRALAVERCRRLGPLLRLRFEDILTAPVTTAYKLGCHVGFSPTYEVADVVKSRSAVAAPDFAIELSLAKEAA